MEVLTNELIQVTQLPIIKEQLEKVKSEIQDSVKYALSLDCTEATYKEIKSVRSKLNKSFSELESKRKEVKKKILSPYEQFEQIYKDCVTDIFLPADRELSQRINDVESGIKERKSRELKEYFEEYAISKGIDFVTFEKLGIKITMNESLKSLKAKAKDFIDRVSDELELISTQKYPAEILVEYKNSLNVSQAVISVENRMKAIEEEQKRLQISNADSEEAGQDVFDESEVLKAPEVVSAPKADNSNEVKTMYVTAFKVSTFDLNHLRIIKETLTNLEKEGLIYEQL